MIALKNAIISFALLRSKYCLCRGRGEHCGDLRSSLEIIQKYLWNIVIMGRSIQTYPCESRWLEILPWTKKGGKLNKPEWDGPDEVIWL